MNQKQKMLDTAIAAGVIYNVKTLDDAKRLFQKQLDRLQVEYVDFYLLHCLDKEK